MIIGGFYQYYLQTVEYEKEVQIEALNQTKNIALSLLSEDVKEYIKSNFGDINSWLTI